MSIHVSAELGVPLPDTLDYPDLLQRAQAACGTAELLAEHGVNITPNEDDENVAAAIVTCYASDPIKTDKAISPAKMSSLPPATVVQVNAILKEFSHAVVTHSVQIRHLVTNKLLIESDNPDPKIRIRALELLGKISDVGLFSEKQEITVTHQSTDDLKKKLREKLDALRARENEVVDVEDTAAIVDRELGLDDVRSDD